jgi:hypothetical protein
MVNVGHWWNDTDRGNWSTGRETLYSVGGRCMNKYGALVEWYWQGKLKYSDRNVSQCHFVHHKCHMDLPGIEPGWVLNATPRPLYPRKVLIPHNKINMRVITRCFADWAKEAVMFASDYSSRTVPQLVPLRQAISNVAHRSLCSNDTFTAPPIKLNDPV